MEKNAMKNQKKDADLVHAVRISEYVDGVKDTDRFSKTDLTPILLGLYGEVGSIMSAAKKLHREKEAFSGYRESVIDEFGDAFWYFTALCRRLNVDVDEIFSKASQNGKYKSFVAASGHAGAPISMVSAISDLPTLDETLLELGACTANLLVIGKEAAEANKTIAAFADAYLHAIQAAKVSFAEALNNNLQKVRGRFLVPNTSTLPTFDLGFSADEQLPIDFEIIITERPNGQSYLQMNGVYIGDPLTDNIHDSDGYRFHDVIHLANAAVLHWSPTFRALIKHKRKSDKRLEEAQDSGRAIVVEEGLSAWIFSRAKQLNFFEGQTSVSLDVLKTVHQFVNGYEVEACPLKLWEDAILQGYAVFREVLKNKGGRVVGSRTTRTIKYLPLEVIKI